MTQLTHEGLKEVLDYNLNTGDFIWRIDKYRVKKGDLAGCINKGLNGRCCRLIKIDGKLYLAHRLAYFYMIGRWPKYDIDHKDRDALNNKWNNIRSATRSQNKMNSKVRSDNSTGLKGVTKMSSGRFYSQIYVDGQSKYLGSFDTAERAHLEYCSAAKKYFGEFARAE